MTGKNVVEIKLEKSNRRRKEIRHTKGLEVCTIDTEEFSRAVQDLGLEVIDAGIEAPLDIMPVRQPKSRRFNLTASAKRALSSMVNRQNKKMNRIKVSLDDFPNVPDHPISA